MKYIKSFKESNINESLFDFIFRRGFPKDKGRIESICYELGIRPHLIHDDGTVDVDGDLILIDYGSGKLPLKFGRVYGDCKFQSYKKDGNKLTSLEGCPHTVDGEFSLQFLTRLSSLRGCPEHVGGEFFILECPITSLEGSPERVRGRFGIYRTKITSLEGLPSVIEGDLDISENYELYSPQGISDLSLNGILILEDNPRKSGKTPLKNIYYLFGNFDDFRRSLDYNYVVLEGGKWKVSRSRLTEALDELDLDTPDSIPMYEYTK